MSEDKTKTVGDLLRLRMSPAGIAMQDNLIRSSEKRLQNMVNTARILQVKPSEVIAMLISTCAIDVSTLLHMMYDTEESHGKLQISRAASAVMFESLMRSIGGAWDDARGSGHVEEILKSRIRNKKSSNGGEPEVS